MTPEERLVQFQNRYDETLAGKSCRRGNEHGLIRWAVDVKGTLRYFVAFLSSDGVTVHYEQYVDADKLVIEDIVCSLCGREPVQRLLIVNGQPTKVTRRIVTCHRCKESIVFCADCLAKKDDEKAFSWLAESHRQPCAVAVTKKEEGQTMTIAITINDLTTDQAQQVLDLAKTFPAAGRAPSSVASTPAAPPKKTAPAPEPEEDDEEEEEAPAPPKKGPPPPKVDQSKVTVAKTPPKPETKKASKPAPEPEPEEEEEEEEEAPAPKKTTAAAKTSTKKAPPPEEDEEEEEEGGDDGDVPDVLLNAKRLRDVIEYLMDEKSITDVDELKAECVRLKDKIPVLGRISNLEERIDRALEVIDTGETS